MSWAPEGGRGSTTSLFHFHDMGVSYDQYEPYQINWINYPMVLPSLLFPSKSTWPTQPVLVVSGLFQDHQFFQTCMIAILTVWQIVLSWVCGICLPESWMRKRMMWQECSSCSCSWVIWREGWIKHLRCWQMGSHVFSRTVGLKATCTAVIAAASAPIHGSGRTCHGRCHWHTEKNKNVTITWSLEWNYNSAL